jgi:hypothetical protein
VFIGSALCLFMWNVVVFFFFFPNLGFDTISPFVKRVIRDWESRPLPVSSDVDWLGLGASSEGVNSVVPPCVELVPPLVQAMCCCSRLVGLWKLSPFHVYEAQAWVVPHKGLIRISWVLSGGYVLVVAHCWWVCGSFSISRIWDSSLGSS